MNRRTHLQSIRLGVLVAGLTGIAMAAYVLRAAPQLDAIQLAVPGSADSATQGTNSIPTRLSIPTLHIEATIEPVGKTSGGLMRSPSNFTDVAWFMFGPQPGEVGSAVIAGHLDNALGLSGVFSNLDTLAVGDKVSVETASKKTLYFEVIYTEAYPYDQVPLDMLFKKNDGVYLNLVTCAGTWLQSHKTYDRRLIVYTKLVAETEHGNQ